MAKYTVEWCEVKKTGETNGRAWKIINMTLKDESGVETTDVSTFDPVTPGLTIEGEIELKGQYKNFKGTPKVAPQGNSGAFKGAQIAKAQETKAEYIAVAQGNKELGIKVSSTIRMAVDLAIAQGAEVANGEPLAARILLWRQWLWQEWDKEEKDYPPFN